MASVLANGILLEYEEFGSKIGTPLLLISGYSGQLINWSMDFIEPLIDAGYRVFRFDNRDIGLSQQFDNAGIPDIRQIAAGLKDGTAAERAPYLLNDMADDAAGLIDALELGPTMVMGVSMGGMITQLLAIRHPDKVKAIVPTMTTSGRPGLPTASKEAQAALLDKPSHVSREAIIESAVKSNRVFGSKGALAASDDELAKKAGDAFNRAYRPAGITRQYAAIVAQPRWHDDLRNVSTPTLVLHGAVDTLIPPACGKDVADHIPGAIYTEIENWGHDMPSAAIPVLHAQLLPFLNLHK